MRALLLLLPGLVFAQGAYLSLPKQPLTAAENAKLQEIRKEADVSGIVRLNKHALDSTVLLLELDGTVHRFIGAKSTTDGVDVWVGRAEEPGSQAVLLRRDGKLFGNISVGNKRYYLALLGEQHAIVRVPPAAPDSEPLKREKK